jgi:hypothetical protein
VFTRLGFALALVLAAVGCGKSSTPTTATPTASASVIASAAPRTSEGDAAPVVDFHLTELWSRAREGDGADLERLADVEGSAGLLEKGAEDALRATALRALAFAHDFVGLPWLATVATDGDDADAALALDAAVELAARPRRANEAEDDDELSEGCTKLLALAKTMTVAKERRIPAIRALRMLVDRGCVKRDQIPHDLDAR